MLNSALTIIYLVAVVNNPEVVSRNPVSSAVWIGSGPQSSLLVAHRRVWRSQAKA